MRHRGVSMAFVALPLALLATSCVVSDPDVDQVGEAVAPAPLDDALDPTISTTVPESPTTPPVPPPEPAPSQIEALLADLRTRADKRPVVGLVAHRASAHPEGRTIDLIAADPQLQLAVIFAPEHGLAGTADAGASVSDSIEELTGVPVISLYGDQRAPSPDQLGGLDVLVYDLQDVGVRAFTYIATLGLVLEAADAAGVPVVIVDRANPQGRISDGPILAPGLESFISPYPVPTAYGLTSGELARMMVGEGWIDAAATPTVIGPPTDLSDPWIAPSPNLPTLESTWLYPAVVPFEATVLSVGRGTSEPFTVIGGTDVMSDEVVADMESRQLLGLDITAATFTPEAIEGMATSPRYVGQELFGITLSTGEPLAEPMRVSVELLDAFMDAAPSRAAIIDRPEVFDRLVGSAAIREALLANEAPADIAALWVSDIDSFTELSARYR